MKLLNLTLRNFKGQTLLTINPEGRDLSIFGDNAAGKTTIADAYHWLLFDKDSAGRSDFEIKPLDASGEPMHRGEHEVTGEFEASGKRIGLRKLYAEKWETRRGGTDQHFAGHTTSYWVNGVPVQKKEYDAQVASICPEKLFRMLSDPRYFAADMKWQDRRAALLELAGKIDDADVIASNPDLADLPKILDGRTADDHRKIASEAVKRLSADIKQIPNRIDELTRIAASAPERIDTKSLAESLQAKIEAKAQAESGGRSAEIRAQIAEARAELAGLQAQHEKAVADAGRECAEAERNRRAAIQAIEDEHRRAKGELLDAESKLARVRATLSDYQHRLGRLRADYTDEEAKRFPTDSELCPTCGQSLPAEQIEAKRAEFNRKRAVRLEQLMASGKEARRFVDATESEIAELEAEIESLKVTVDAASKRMAVGIAQQPESKALVIEPPAGIAEIKSRIAKLEAELTDTKGSASAELAVEVQTARELLDTANRVNAEADAADKAKARIKELASEEKRMAEEHDRLQHEIWLIEEFTRARARMLTDRINGHFEIAKFRLFEEQVNGGIKEVCDVTVDGVPYGDLNHGKQLNAGLDIIDAFAKKFDFAPPVILDNSESVTCIRRTLGQQIRLIVSAADKKLRIETETAQRSLI